MKSREDGNSSKTELINACGDLLKIKKLSIAFAESATAGRVMADFSLLENAGEFLIGGLVCYDANLKKDILKVPSDLIEMYTAESAEVTESLAIGLKLFIKGDVHVAITGLTAPGGSETESKPVGTIFIHFLHKNKSIADRKLFEGDRESIMEQTVNHIAHRLLTILKDD